MRVLYDICDMVEDELEDIVKNGKLNPDTLEIIGDSVDIVKDIETIHAMNGEYSYGRTRDDGYSNRMYYDDGYSMARGRNDGGRSSRDMRGMRTRHDEKEMLEEKLEELKHQLNQMK